MKASPDGLKLAQVFYGSRIVETCSFDPTTGEVSNPVLLQAEEFFDVYGVEFSPDGKLLYVSSGASFAGGPPARVHQLSLKKTSASEILNS
ncbi:hypothetical protein K3G39_06240 [Pontibacter sp. HSC-14F20]|uniref:hypothetical protein n=1 Tax=Pontibacter sp. HSC-14F20 TaxID=2864136 RepID=UPI001C735504|nr:hypothetical protein [Pontibacter sp. HSC-14F20]MBX0332830.1 hypothetical protein [Pontibacter sp. HSC-14F20]